MVVLCPMATLFVRDAFSSMVPRLYDSISWRMSWFASSSSSGFPVSFHQPCTFWMVTFAPRMIRVWMVSVISSSPLHEGLICLRALKTLSLKT